jgi:dihydrofolate reductase
MRRVIFSMFVSLDGFITGPKGELDWAIVDEELHSYVNQQQDTIDTYLYGRRLYETMSYWGTADHDPTATPYELEFARIWNVTPKVVFSTTLDKVEWNSRLVKGDLAAEVAKLKALPGKDMEVGGAALAASFAQLGLIDEYQVYIHPVLVGAGTPMFQNRDHLQTLRLAGTHVFRSGVVHLKYDLS